MYAVELLRLNDILNILQRHYTVFVPADGANNADSAGSTGFIRYGGSSGDDRSPDGETRINLKQNVHLSPKQHFFPQTQALYRFQSIRNSIEIESLGPSDEQYLFFGVRSCDMKSLDCLDQVFLSKAYADTFYKARRDHTVIIALSCAEPGPNCFCTSMGVDPLQAKGADIQAWISGDMLGLKPLTSAGKQVMALVHDKAGQNLLHPAAADFVPQGGEPQLKAEVEGITEKLQRLFESALWDDIARKCLNCGACTYICPTCHCFDIAQDVRGENGVKYRCWDSCMFKEYTQMAGGHNPRSGKKEKVRNRFMHKLRYFHERHGMMLCTGCGRCLGVCPVNMDITAVIRTLKEAE